MKTKGILRFYFSADSLNEALDNLIMRLACAFDADGSKLSERLCRIVGEKCDLERLWAELDDILVSFSKEERAALKGYSSRRALRAEGERGRFVKRTVIKFMRRARRLNGFGEEMATLGRYSCLVKDAGGEEVRA